MSKTFFAGILLLVITILYVIQKRTERKPKIDTFVDASGSKVDSSGNGVDYGFADLFAKFLNKLVDSAKFAPSDEAEKVIDVVTTPDQELINSNLEKQMSPMIAQGIDALRLASSAQNNY